MRMAAYHSVHGNEAVVGAIAAVILRLVGADGFSFFVVWRSRWCFQRRQCLVTKIPGV